MSVIDSAQRVRFGDFELDVAAYELRRAGRPVRMERQPMDLLILLVQRRNQLVSRSDIVDLLWSKDVFVDVEAGINTAIRKIRLALRDSLDAPEFVETVSGKGYRFISPVDVILSSRAVPEPPSLSEPQLLQSLDQAGTALDISRDPSAAESTEHKVGPGTNRTNHIRVFLFVVALLAPVLIGVGVWLYFRLEKSIEVRQLEFKGNFYATKWTEDEIWKGIDYYNRAIALDPNNASAYDGIATAWIFLTDLYVSPRQAMPNAKAAALSALQRDDTFVRAHLALAVFKMEYEWDWAGAEQDFKRLIAGPDPGLAQQLYGWCLIAVGRFDEAQALMRRAVEAEPLNDFAIWESGLSFYFARDYEQAVEQYRRAIGVERKSYWPHMLLGWAYEQQGKFSEAIAELNRAFRLNDNSQVLASLGHAYAVSGQVTKAQGILAELQETAKHRYVSPYDVATIYAGLGEKEQAFVWLEKSYRDRSGWLALWVKVDPKFDILRSDPRFSDLLRRVGHTP